MSDFLSQIAAKEMNSTTVIRPQLGSLFIPWPNSANFSPAFPNSDFNNLNADKSTSSKSLAEIQFAQGSESEPNSQYPNHLSQLLQTEQVRSRLQIDQDREATESHHAPSDQISLSSMESVRVGIEQSISSKGWLGQNSREPTSRTLTNEPIQPAQVIEQQLEKDQLMQSETSDKGTMKTEKSALNTRLPEHTQGRHRVATSFSVKQNVNTDSPVGTDKGSIHANLPDTEIISTQRAIDTVSRLTMISPNLLDYQQATIVDRPKATTAKESTPTIRVNIGRIEVCAVMPAAPSSRQQRKRETPIMSLQDYLKQRNGG
jgi:hypothetical protein